MDSNDDIYSSRKILIAYLKIDKVSTKILNEYAKFINIFSPKLAAKLSKYTKIHNHVIK